MTTSTHYINKDNPNNTIYVDLIQDAGATTPGDPLTGLAYTDMTIYYNRPLGSATVLAAATQTVTGTHYDGGFVEVDSTNMPGHYRLDLSDAICATGVNDAYVTLTSTNSAPHTAHIVLTDAVPETNPVQLGGSAQSLTDLKDFADAGYDPSTHKVQNVLLTDTTTTNTDMLTVAAILGATAASYITAGTIGEAIALGSAALADSTITGTPSSTTFDFTGGSTVDNFYSDQLVYILSGTGIGQVRPILSSTYVGGTTTITVDEPFIVTPAAADRFAIIVTHVHPKTQITNSVLTTQFTESYSTDGAAPTLTQAVMLIQQYLTEKAISGTTLTINKLDGTTPAATLTLDSGSAPTSATRAT